VRSKNYITIHPDTQKSIQLLLDSCRDTIIEKTSVVIQIDLSFPYVSPVTTNPEILYYVIEHLEKMGVKEITVIGGTLPSVNSIKVWEMLGFDVYISQKFPNVRFIPVEGNLTKKTIYEIDIGQIKFPKIVEDSVLFISIINPKISAISDIHLSIENSMSLVEDYNSLFENQINDGEYCEKNLYLEKYKKCAIKIHQIRPPDLVLYDFSSVLSKAGPLMYSDSIILHSNCLMASENSIIGDYIALKMLGKNPDDNLIIKALKNADYSLISQGVLNEAEVYIMENFENKAQFNKITSWLTDVPNDFDRKSSFWKRKGLKENNHLPIIDGIEPFIDLFDVFPQKTEISKGLICSGCKQHATELLLLLKTAMQKDQEVIPSFSFLLGKNPQEPKNEYCMVFGDCAIQTTKDRKFRKKIVQRLAISERDPDLERAKLKIRLQKRLVDLRSHEEFINYEITEDRIKAKAIKKLTRKIKRTEYINEYRLKIHEILSTYQQNRVKKNLQHQKFISNKNILEIPGCPPFYFHFLKNVIKLFRKRWVPGLARSKIFFELCLNQKFPIDPAQNLNTETEMQK